jgi:hypothetical protein
MINVTVTCPSAPDKAFDTGYYLAAHIRMAKSLWGSALKDVRVSDGIGAAEP